MKQLLLLLPMILAPAEANAISRYRSTSYSCDEVRHIVRREGAVIMRWSSARVRNLPRYERIVASDRFCNPHQVTDRTLIPTTDTAKCPVLYCVEPDDFDGYVFRRRH